MRDFDLYVGIDWSGAKSPIRSKSISLSWCYAGSDCPEFIKNPLSRDDVAYWILDRVNEGKKLFIGIDCNLSYSSQMMDKMMGRDPTPQELWAHINSFGSTDDNLCAESFWLDKKHSQYFWMGGHKPNWYDKSLTNRLTDITCAKSALGVPECPFKLIGPKQVGKAGLSGMRLAHFLLNKLSERISIWPFQESNNCTQIIMAEIYPRLFWRRAGLDNKKITDLDVINNSLEFYNSMPVSKEELLNDHQSDALISAVAIRDFIQSRALDFDAYLNFPHSIKEFVSKEGWIFGLDVPKEV